MKILNEIFSLIEYLLFISLFFFSMYAVIHFRGHFREVFLCIRVLGSVLFKDTTLSAPGDQTCCFLILSLMLYHCVTALHQYSTVFKQNQYTCMSRGKATVCTYKMLLQLFIFFFLFN